MAWKSRHAERESGEDERGKGTEAGIESRRLVSGRGRAEEEEEEKREAVVEVEA